MKLQIRTASNVDRWSKPCKNAVAEPTGKVDKITLYSPNFYYPDIDDDRPSIESQIAAWKEEIKNLIYGNPELFWNFWDEGLTSKHKRGTVTFDAPINVWYVEITTMQDLFDLVDEVGEVIVDKDHSILIYDGYIE